MYVEGGRKKNHQSQTPETADTRDSFHSQWDIVGSNFIDINAFVFLQNYAVLKVFSSNNKLCCDKSLSLR